jgi:hypothetical protein
MDNWEEMERKEDWKNEDRTRPKNNYNEGQWTCLLHINLM